jgi:hypothetical protein
MNANIIYENQLISKLNIGDCTDDKGHFVYANLKPQLASLEKNYLWCALSAKVQLISFEDAPTALVFCAFAKHANADKWNLNTFHFPIVNGQCDIPIFKNKFIDRSNVGYSGSHYINHFVVLFNSNAPVEYSIKISQTGMDSNYENYPTPNGVTLHNIVF